MTAPHQDFFDMAQQGPTVMPQELMPAQHAAPPQVHPPVNSYYPESHNELSGDLPINLDSLRDGPPGSKPFYPYSTLIRYAIKGSPNHKLLLEDIYYAIESRFPYFRTAPPGWKNSIRHNLSLNPCFEKVPRPLTDRGKGCYWIVNDNVDPRTGVHRVRKKKPKSGSKRGQPSHDHDHDHDPDHDQAQQQQTQSQDEMDYHHAGTSADAAQAAAAPPNVYQDPNFGAPSVMPADGSDPNRQAQAAYPPPYGTFDPTFFHPGMRYQPPPLFRPDEAVPMDAHGNPDWGQLWHKELANLLQLTEQQDKAGADPEWYRQMWFRVRNAMIMPVMPTADMSQAQQGMPGAPTGGVQGTTQ